MEGKDYICHLILQCKLGNKEDFKTLWNAYKFLFDQIYNNFLSMYPCIEYRKIEIYGNFYIWLWSEVNNYEFDKNSTFSYALQEKVIDNMRQYLEEECFIPSKKIVKKEEFKKSLSRKIKNKNKKVYYALKTLTPKQLRIVYLKVYKKMKFKDLVQIDTSEKLQFELSIKKMTKVIWGIKTKNKVKKVKEKARALPD